MREVSSGPWFKPLDYRGKQFPSRVVLAPINTGFARASRATAQLLRFHDRRSGPALGLSTIGNVAVDHQWVTNQNTVVLRDRRDLPRLAAISQRIRGNGSLSGIQIAHALPQLAPTRGWRARDKAGEIARLSRIVEELTSAEIERSFDEFSRSAQAAASCFDVIQIHAAHGYLLSLFLTEGINRRSDKYGIARDWLERMIARLREACGASLLAIRLSTYVGVREPDAEATATIALSRRLARAGVDLLDLSAGLYTLDRRLIYPAPVNQAPYASIAAKVAASVSCLVAFAGGVLDLRLLPAPTAANMLVSIGRGLIADPTLADKSARGEFEAIRWCQRTNQCHYFTRGKTQLECGVNEELSA